MEAKDLRIGNFVVTNFKREKEVTDIDHVSFIEDFMKLYDPIPLTEEWLLKFGFKIDKQHECDFASIGVFTISFRDNFFYDYTNLKYVHQLQNLYFALTGEELTIKE
jgi:hypothetical protein